MANCVQLVMMEYHRHNLPHMSQVTSLQMKLNRSQNMAVTEVPRG